MKELGVFVPGLLPIFAFIVLSCIVFIFNLYAAQNHYELNSHIKQVYK